MESSTQPTESSKRKGKAHVPTDLESDPSSSDSSLSESDSSNDSNYRKSKSKKSDKKKNRWKHKKNDSSDSSPSDYDSSDDSGYIRKRLKNKKIHRKKDPIKIIRKVNGKVADDSIYIKYHQIHTG